MAAYKFSESSANIKFPALLFLFFIYAINTFGQPFPASLGFLNEAENSRFEGNLNIVAVMVEFQPDSNRFTSGNGTFETGALPFLDDPAVKIDPLPHNQTYFEAHLKFVKNYFEQMSSGKLRVHYQVLPQIYRLPGKMEDYSPVGEHPDLSSMAHFSAEVWALVASQTSDLLLPNTHENTVFVIFHAGVGRDIELTGTSLLRTPQDLPSLYFDKNAFQEYLQDPSFSGFPLNGGQTLVDNTIILPRTLSREGEDISGEPYVLQLSINGLATALVGSHLGLPNLFNTETGRSGIGRFGLMDGAGMFSYRGLFPPEMSAWEKLYAGWANAVTIPVAEENTYQLPAASLRQENSIIRIPISGDEYFLIENRHRDPEHSGVTLTIQRPDGTTAQQTFTNQNSEFTAQESGFEEMLEPGVVTSVSNFDFSLPGGLEHSESNHANRELNGGILIWHVDEAVIREKLGITGINNDETHRAVTLKEADGAQDIGRPVSTGIFQNETNGWPFDFWWAGNNASVIFPGDTLQLYQNRFGYDTLPDNRSHSGAPAYFELSDFSENLPVASFSISPVNPYANLYEPVQINQKEITEHDLFFISTESGHPANYPPALIPFKTNGLEGVLIPAQNALFYLDTEHMAVKKIHETRRKIRHPLLHENHQQIAVASENDSDELSIALFDFSPDTLLLKWEYAPENVNGFLSQAGPNRIDADHTNVQLSISSGDVIYKEAASQSSERLGDYGSEIKNGTLILHYPGGNQTHNISGFSENSRNHTGIIQHNENISFYFLGDQKLGYFSEENNYEHASVISENVHIGWPAIVDFNQDGNPTFIFIDHDNNRLIAKNSRGGMLPNFPIRPPTGSAFTGTPLVADVNGDGNLEIIISVQNPYSLSYYAYNTQGNVVPGFPVHAGAVQASSHTPLNPVLSGNYLIGISPVGELKAWHFPDITNQAWQSAYGNKTSNNVSSVISSSVVPAQPETLLVAAETYNWPNPASNQTYVRVKTTENAEVNLKVISLSGQLIFENEFNTVHGIAQDFEIDTTNWANGGYIALVTAKAGNLKEQKRIKIAIVK